MPVSPIHDDEAADDGGEVAGADVAVEGRQPAEEDGAVPEVEVGFWEAPAEEVERERGGGADEEAVGERSVDLLAEEFSWALDRCVSFGL